MRLVKRLSTFKSQFESSTEESDVDPVSVLYSTMADFFTGIGRLESKLYLHVAQKEKTIYDRSLHIVPTFNKIGQNLGLGKLGDKQLENIKKSGVQMRRLEKNLTDTFENLSESLFQSLEQYSNPEREEANENMKHTNTINQFFIDIPL